MNRPPGCHENCQLEMPSPAKRRRCFGVQDSMPSPGNMSRLSRSEKSASVFFFPPRSMAFLSTGCSFLSCHAMNPIFSSIVDRHGMRVPCEKDLAPSRLARLRGSEIENHAIFQAKVQKCVLVTPMMMRGSIQYMFRKMQTVWLRPYVPPWLHDFPVGKTDPLWRECGAM